jgi:phage baseplate assembly protein W
MSDPAGLFGRSIAFPPRVGADGRVAWSYGENNVRESIRIILRTDERERLHQPDFGGGLTRFLFDPNTATTRQLIRDRIQRALAAWEPRVQVDDVIVDADPKDPESAIATITYRLVATRTLERVSLTVALTGS